MLSPVSLLVVCSANRCRSPIAAALLTNLLHQRGIDDEVTVRSAGFDDPGLPATPHAVRVLAEHGIDLSGHRSHRCTRDDLAWADLVVTMERQHLHQVAALDLATVRRCFPLREVVRLAAERGPRDVPFDRWVQDLDAGRAPARVLSTATADDVADPTGGWIRRHRRTVAQIDALVRDLVTFAWPESTG